jgi:hypothetical protein
MKRLLKGLGMVLLALMLVGGVVYAYTAITVTSEVEVQEPISIVSVEGDGAFESDTNTWNIGEIYPLDTASITITFANASAGTITLTLTANPASLDDDNLSFSFDNETVDVPGMGTATVTLTANTTQSLAPGNYSTQITVER